MDQLSILPPSYTAAASGADRLAQGPGDGAARPTAAQGSGFAVRSMEALFGSSRSDSVALNAVKIELDVDESTNRVVATVTDRESGAILNQFPAEAILENARGIRELLARELDLKV